MALPATATENNTVSAQDYAVRDGECLAWCQRSEMMPGSLLYYSSKEYTKSPLNNKLKDGSVSSSVAAPSNTTLICCRNNAILKVVAWPNAKMMKGSSNPLLP